MNIGDLDIAWKDYFTKNKTFPFREIRKQLVSASDSLAFTDWFYHYVFNYKDKTLDRLPIEEIKIDTKVRSLINNAYGVIGDIWKHDDFRDGPRTVVKIYWFNDNISICHLETDCDVIVLR